MVKYSIIIPTYNKLEKFLKKCVDSIIKYTNLDNIEVIIVSNGSTDLTDEYVKSLGSQFKLISFPEPLGYPKAINEGIIQSVGQYIILLNNDTILLEQPKSYWIDLLEKPFIENKKTGITGPVKFSWDCGGIIRKAMAFWCVMIPKKLFDELGLLEEIFSPGMGEDGAFCIKTEIRGYDLVSVPSNLVGEFNSGIINFDFPIYHKGNGTFADNNEEKDKVIKRNTKILEEKYASDLEKSYDWCLNHPCDTNELFPLLRKYSEDCNNIIEMGVRDVFTTYAFLSAKPKKIVCYDTYLSPNIWSADTLAKNNSIDFSFIHKNVLETSIEETDLLFIDTRHTYEQLSKELNLHSQNVKKYILLHDTKTYGEIGEDGSEGLWKAVLDFLEKNKNWKMHEKVDYSNGLTVLKRCEKIDTKNYGIKRNYISRDYVPDFNDTELKDEWQDEVYLKALGIAKKNNFKKILDIGCGSGFKLLKYFSDYETLGLELRPIYHWLTKKYPNKKWDISENFHKLDKNFDIIICSDVIEHVLDPDYIINLIKEFDFKYLIVSTPDRNLIYPSKSNLNNGVPRNPYHVREWSFNEFEEYISQSFKITEHFISNEKQWTQCIICNRINKKVDISIVIPTYNHFDDAFKECIDKVLNYTDLSNKEIIVVANGCTDQTLDYIKLLNDNVDYIYIKDPCGYVRAVNAGIKKSVGEYIILIDNDSHLMEQNIDSWINILMKPLLEDKNVAASSPFANDYPDLGFVLHSGCTLYRKKVLEEIGMFDEIYNPGYLSDSDVSLKIWKAGYKCVEVPIENPKKTYSNGIFGIDFPVIHTGNVRTMDKIADIDIIKKNREILYSRYIKKNSLKYSVVIPTYNKCEELLKPCLESIMAYTDLSNFEIIVVANGCNDETEEYVKLLGEPFKLISRPEPLGYTKATNLGIIESKGDFVILLNNDTVFLSQNINDWIQKLEAPFINDSSVGITGPLKLYDNYSNAEVIIFFCAMIKKELFEKIGLLNEIYTPGGGEDVSFSIEAQRLGYKIVQVPKEGKLDFATTNTGDFPIWHKDNRTFVEMPEYTKTIVKRNGLINCKKYNKNIKLNLGSGGVEIPGYLSVDLYDKRANIIYDVTKLNDIFDENSIEELICSHLFEHLNPYNSIDILKNWFYILKLGGKLIMEMPDIEQLCKRFITANVGERYGILNAIYGSVNTHQALDDPNLDKKIITSSHLFGWWPQSINDHLLNAGFVDIKFGPEIWPHPESNMHVEAVKP